MRSWTFVSVHSTNVTSTWDESVVRTQLKRRESSACTKHATSCQRAPKIRIFDITLDNTQVYINLVQVIYHWNCEHKNIDINYRSTYAVI